MDSSFPFLGKLINNLKGWEKKNDGKSQKICENLISADLPACPLAQLICNHCTTIFNGSNVRKPRENLEKTTKFINAMIFNNIVFFLIINV